MRIHVTAALIVMLLAGCSASNGPDGQSAQGAGHLAYNGGSPGEHQATSPCDDRGTLSWAGNLASGKVDVRVLDGEGKQVFSVLYSQVGQSSDTKPVLGAPGQWTLQAERIASASYGASAWSGQYDLHLAC